MKFIQLQLSACALVFAALGLAACSSGQDESTGESGATSEDEAAVTTPANETAYDFFVSKGLKNFQAAGIVGNSIKNRVSTRPRSSTAADLVAGSRNGRSVDAGMPIVETTSPPTQRRNGHRCGR